MNQAILNAVQQGQAQQQGKNAMHTGAFLQCYAAMIAAEYKHDELERLDHEQLANQETYGDEYEPPEQPEIHINAPRRLDLASKCAKYMIEHIR